MAQLVAIRSLVRRVGFRVKNVDGDWVRPSATEDVIIDLDDAENRRQLAHHSAIGQFVVSAANASAGPEGSKTALDANA